MRLILIAASLLPCAAYAFFCPNNFNQIQLGYTIDQVNTACGKPDKEVSKDAEPPTPQEWNYFTAPAASPSAYIQASNPLKISIQFDKDGKVIYISVNGVSMGSSTFCGNTTIQLGNSIEQIKAACGKPETINKQQAQTASGEQAPKSKETTYTYGNKTLVFTDGVLTGN
jgi:hypothetical protein